MDLWLWVAIGAVAVISVITSAGFVAHHLRFYAYHRHKGLDVPPRLVPSLREELRAYVILAWWHVWALLRDGLRIPEQVAGRPVVFVHGYSQDATNFHGHRKQLERLGRPTAGISMIPAGFAPLWWYAWLLERGLQRVVGQSTDGVDLVAHSMGGIVLRMVLTARPDLAAAVRTVVTLGSPHQGTAATRGIPLWPELVALKRSSRLIGELAPLTQLAPHARVVTVAAEMDTIVYPSETAFAPGAERVVVPGVGHAGLLTDPRALEAVARALTPGRVGGP
jgi:triacylglycerol esterase/lipase EstA (alpha/beta hydrolase family)